MSILCIVIADVHISGASAASAVFHDTAV